MPAQIIIALIVGLGAGIIVGLLARGRLSLRCLNCRATLPQQCADKAACNRRREALDLQRIAN